jgi:hypothetical protein
MAEKYRVLLWQRIKGQVRHPLHDYQQDIVGYLC